MHNFQPGGTVHFDPALSDNVLLTHLRNYTVDIASGAVTRQILALHHVPSGPVCAHNDRHLKHALPKTIHPPNGALGTAHLHPQTTKDPSHAGPQAHQRRSRRANEGTVHTVYITYYYRHV